MTRREIIERAAGVLGAIGLGAAVQSAPPVLKATTPVLPTGNTDGLTERTAAGTWTDTQAPAYTTRPGGAWADDGTRQEPLWTFTALRLIEKDGEYSKFPETYETHIQDVLVVSRSV